MKRWIFAVAIAAVASIIVAGTASADVARHQETTTTTTTTTTQTLSGAKLTLNLPSIGNLVHTFQININPDGTFTGSGSSVQNIPWAINETITGSLNNGLLSFDADYGDSAKGYAGWENFVGYHWGIPAPGGAADSSMATDSLGSPAFVADWTLSDMQYTPSTSISTTSTSSDYKNHGDYVTSQDGGKEAAHSDIGKPVKSKSGK